MKRNVRESLESEAASMFILHVDIVLKAGLRDRFLSTFESDFTPAISIQRGYSSAILLKPTEADVGLDYRLVISFASHEAQKTWVATDLHQRVWPAMEARIERYTVLSFDLS
jgi:heme-degrading monooxygenase HmoA